jgi:tRNA (mo5U34)-methyltransferase
MSIGRAIRTRAGRVLPRGHVWRIGPVAVERRSEGLLIGRTDAHPEYGRQYRIEALPPGLSAEGLQRYVSQTGWYHEIALGDGVLTPGMKSAETISREWELFGLGDLKGQSVLDIGGVDGGYAFRAEQSGASPVAVLDHYLWATDHARYSTLYNEHRLAGTTPPAPHESDAWHPESTPARWRFDTARQALRSDVQALPLDFADCDLAAVGQWDVVLFLGVLYHLPDPIGILRRLASVTRRQAIIETEAMLIRDHPEGLSRFFPSGELNNDRSNWWVPNMSALLGLIGAAGFRDAEILVGEPEDDQREGNGPHHYRAIVRAVK